MRHCVTRRCRSGSAVHRVCSKRSDATAIYLGISDVVPNSAPVPDLRSSIIYPLNTGLMIVVMLMLGVGRRRFYLSRIFSGACSYIRPSSNLFFDNGRLANINLTSEKMHVTPLGFRVREVIREELSPVNGFQKGGSCASYAFFKRISV